MIRSTNLFSRNHPTLILVKKRRSTNATGGVLITFRRCFPVNIGKFLRAPILENICVRLLLKWILLFRTFFLDSGFQNHPEVVILQKFQSLLNQSFKHNLAYMPSLNLTPALSFEPRFLGFVCLSLTVTTEKANTCGLWTSCFLSILPIH